MSNSLTRIGIEWQINSALILAQICLSMVEESTARITEKLVQHLDAFEALDPHQNSAIIEALDT